MGQKGTTSCPCMCVFVNEQCPAGSVTLGCCVLCQVHAGPGRHVGIQTKYDLFLPVEVRLPYLSHRPHHSHGHRNDHQPSRIQRLGSGAGQFVSG